MSTGAVYIPIIKWQSWEQKALEKVDDSIRPRLLPCVEVRDSSQHQNLINKLSDVWPNDVMIDYANPKGILTPNRLIELQEFLEIAIDNSMPVIPVLGPEHISSATPRLLDSIAKFKYIGIRLRITDLVISTKDIDKVKTAVFTLQKSNISHSLIIDLGTTPDEWSNEDIEKFTASLTELKSLFNIRFHLISGAYPSSLASVKAGVTKFERRDWRLWSEIAKRTNGLAIGYGDYGILSPEWTEEVLIRRSGSRVIRYTRDDNWLIIKSGGATVDDSIAISEILINLYAGDFKGESFSFGDKLLADRASPSVSKKNKKCGHYHITEAWSHHIAFVLKEQY
ncbi:beta family protein [Methylophaga sp.]|uniref:beta family protein n=1 Tax=Methylophaga sp. TaxID=2024840 RepID=UPI003A8FF7A9